MSFWHSIPPVHSPISPATIRAAAKADPRAPQALSSFLQAACRRDAVLLTDSGTSALAMAIAASARTGGARPVALPAYACYDLVSAALAAQVPMTFYDVDPETFAPDAASVEDAISSGVSSLVVVHQYGVRVPLVPLRARCEAAGALLIEDAAQGWGGGTREEPLGATGHFGVLSFGRGKGLTGGGGGALLADDRHARLVAALPVVPSLRLRTSALLAAQWLLARPALYRLPLMLPGLGLGETHFREPHPPSGITASAAGAVLAAATSLVDAEVASRRSVAQRYLEELQGVRHLRVPQLREDAALSAWLRFPVCVLGDRAAVARQLRHLGVAAGYPQPLPRLPQAQPWLRAPRPTPGAERLAAQALTLPTHSFVTPDARRRLVDALRDA